MAQQFTATAAQMASALMHLEMRSEWRTVRIGDVRYVVLVSGNSGRVYYVRADGRGCDCVWSQRAATPCSHRVAVELAAIEDELREEYVVGSASLKAMRDLFPGCAGGCGQIVEARDGLWCDDCAAQRERAERMAAARARVLSEVMA